MTDTLVVPPEARSAGAPQRKGKALLGWVPEHDVRSLFYAAAVTSPLDVEEFVDTGRTLRRIRAGLPAAAPGMMEIAELPAGARSRIESLQATTQFQTVYEPFGAQFAVISLADLVTPQWWVDAQYVDELAAVAPAEDDVDGMFGFSFSTGQLGRPMNLGLNGAAFASARGDIGVPGPLRVAQYSPEKVTFEFDVTPRPNWVWVAAVQEMGRLFIVNGVHHLLAMMKAGREHAYCLIRGVRSLGDLVSCGWNPQSIDMFKPNELTSDRPPLLRDYLDEHHAADVGIHLREFYLRFAIQAEPGMIPRAELPAEPGAILRVERPAA
jgi:hypothetical protein